MRFARLKGGAILAAAMIAVSACAHPTPPSGDTRAIEALQDEIDAAMMANDAAALGRYLDTNVTRTGPAGMVTNRAQWLAQIEAGQIRYLSVRRCETRIVFYPNTAVVTGLVDIEVEKPVTGREIEHNRYTRTYVQTAAGWRLAAHQATRAPEGVSC